jgi:hypothetical protein
MGFDFLVLQMARISGIRGYCNMVYFHPASTMDIMHAMHVGLAEKPHDEGVVGAVSV